MRMIDSRVVNIDELELEHFAKGDKFECDAVRMGPLLRAGDVICCPTGGPETAHQIVNDSDAELACLSVSTMLPAEVCEYPDSRNIGAFGGGLRHMNRVDHPQRIHRNPAVRTRRSALCRGQRRAPR